MEKQDCWIQNLGESVDGGEADVMRVGSPGADAC